MQAHRVRAQLADHGGYVEYAEPGGTSRVSSCDLYDFTDGRLTSITSYTVELR